MAVERPRSPAPAGLRLLGLTRFLILIGVVAIFAAATALFVYGAVATAKLIAGLVAPGAAPLGGEALMLASIKLVDLFLLATVLYVVALGLFELFIDNRIPLPAWLRIDDIDDLKHKLTSVVVTILGVVFLGQAISWDGSRDLLPFGLAVAAVIVALSYFLSVRAGKDKPADPDGS